MTENYAAEKAILIKELSSMTEVLHGSWVERFTTCGNKKCKCHQQKSERHGPRRYLVINENGRQRQKYISSGLVERAKDGIQQHQRLKEIVDRLTMINLTIMKEEK